MRIHRWLALSAGRTAVREIGRGAAGSRSWVGAREVTSGSPIARTPSGAVRPCSAAWARAAACTSSTVGASARHTCGSTLAGEAPPAAHLVTIEGAAESSCLGAALGAGARAWIGYRQDPTGAEPAGGWRWMSGAASPFTNWFATQPNDNVDVDPQGQDCAFAEGSAGQWYDHECGAVELGYACER